jgi:hypothetical protein
MPKNYNPGKERKKTLDRCVLVPTIDRVFLHFPYFFSSMVRKLGDFRMFTELGYFYNEGDDDANYLKVAPVGNRNFSTKILNGVGLYVKNCNLLLEKAI